MKFFLMKKKEMVETGEILFANLQISGQNNSLYIILIKKEVKGTMMKMVKVLKKH